jgi:predicted ATPase
LELSEDERASLLAVVPKRGDVADNAPTLTEAAVPVPPAPLVGRERDLEEVSDFLRRRDMRLLTLTGTGGVGKTRLALEAARHAGEFVPDGVAFIALAPLNDAGLVIPTVARSLGLRETPGQTPREALREHLRDRRMLLVLDNFEHVMQAAPAVADLLEFCPNLEMLVTSRAPLLVRGEQEYPVPPLKLPSSTLSPAPEEVAGSPSGRLFVERARAAFPAFELTRENAVAVAAICWRLAGLPLALELAAVRTRFLDPAALLGRLDQALSAGWARDLPERQQTMSATLDWSYNLLSEGEQVLFRRLSVFSGGFSLEAAEAIGAIEEPDVVLGLLGALVEHSLISATPNGDGVRYGMLEPVRQYAGEKLEQSDEAEGVRRRHARHFLAFAERAGSRIKGHSQVEWLDRLETENDNLRAAIGWSLEVEDAQTAARFGWALGMYWVMRSRHGEGRMWMEQTLASADLPAKMRGRAHWALAVCIYGSGDDQRLAAVAEEGVALCRQANDRDGEANAMGIMGFAALMLGEFDGATRLLEEALQIFRELGDEWGSSHILTHLALVPLRRGDYPRAAGYAGEALTLSRRTGDRFAANIALNALAQAALMSGEHGRADHYFREALVIAHEMRDRIDAAYCIQGLAATAGARDEPRRAAQMLGSADALLETTGASIRATADRGLHQRTASGARERLGEVAWAAAWYEGQAMTFDEAVAYALADDVTSSAIP